jgi:serine/threonine-protein kinase
VTIQSFGRYRILRELGRGTLATVYLARDPSSGQQVAVKVLAENITSAPDFDERFQAELQKLKALDHPGLVKLVDYGREGSQYFIVGRYLPGGSLADRLEGRPLLLAEVVPILKRLADALDAAHTAGIVHGNLSPANVLFDLQQRSYLADLGLSHLIAPAAGPELSGAPEYMSPEQAQGGAIDGRSDVYSLGAILYEMLTGRQPFSAESAFQLLRQHVEQPVPQLSDEALARLVLPADFNQVLARAMAKNPDERYPTAGVLAEAVRSRFVMAPTESDAAEAAAPRAILAGVPAGSPPPAQPPPPAGSAAAFAAPEGGAIPVVGELVREPEPAGVRAMAVPLMLGIGVIVLVLLLWAILRLPGISGLLRGQTATPTATLFEVATLTPAPSRTSAPTATKAATAAARPSATTRASVVPSATTRPSATPSRTTAPTATQTATSTRTQRPQPTRTPIPSATDTAEPSTATSTTTNAPPPPPAPTNTPVPTVAPTLPPTASPTSPTPTLTPQLIGTP